MLVVLLIRVRYTSVIFTQQQRGDGKLVENPDHIEQHEFGYAPVGSGMIRHLSFRNMGDLLATLVRDVPADVYCSNGYYRFPNYPMHEKQRI